MRALKPDMEVEADMRPPGKRKAPKLARPPGTRQSGLQDRNAVRSIKAVARLLGLTEVQAKRQEQRAMDKLRKGLEQWYPNGRPPE